MIWRNTAMTATASNRYGVGLAECCGAQPRTSAWQARFLTCPDGLGGYLLLPAPAEPHAHLDKAFTAARIANPTGDLDGAVQAWRQHSASMGHEDVVERATAA